MSGDVICLIGGAIAIATFLLFVAARSMWEPVAQPRPEPEREAVVIPEPEPKPDPFAGALDLLASYLRAGMSLEQAMARVGAEGEGEGEGELPVADEFARCAAQIKLGLPIRSALEGLAKRLPQFDVSALASAVMVVQTTGGNLPMLMERLAQSVHARQSKPAPPAPVIAPAPPPPAPPAPPAPSLLADMGRVLLIPITLAAPVIVAALLAWQPHVVNDLLNKAGGPWIAGAAVTLEVLGLLGVYRLLQLDMGS